jgi:23S rRNA (uracil1939-C5)-methyltransferase
MMKKQNKQIKGLRIEKHALGGYGLGFDDGLAIFVPYAHPGDVVDVSITKSRKDHAFAQVQDYISRGETMPDELCPSFGPQKACGGCDWQDLSYASQLKYKLELLQELFSGKGMQVLPEEIHPSPLEFHYRNAVQGLALASINPERIRW